MYSNNVPFIIVTDNIKRPVLFFFTNTFAMVYVAQFDH